MTWIPEGYSGAVGSGTDYGPQIAELQNKNTTQDGVIQTVDSKLDSAINKTTSIDQRVVVLENSSGGGGGEAGTDYSAAIIDIQNKNISQDSTIALVSSKADSVAANNVVLDQRVSAIEERPLAKDYDTVITSIQAKNTTQDSRLTAIDSSLLLKAPLVAGKVPYENLPEFPVGRKVNVANRASRLKLPQYTDLTIAYESDTGDAYGLDANADPAIDSNWSKLGNAQALNVASFNGRTGNIGPQTGDYITDQISETLTKQFVTPEQKAKWDSYSAAVQVTTFKGRNGSVVPAAGDYTSELITETTAKQFISASDKALIAALNSRLAALEARAAYVRTWKLYNNTTERVQNTWYTNTTPREIIVDAQSNGVSNFVFMRIEIKANASATAFSINSNNANGSIPFVAKVTAQIPAGWMYRITDNAGGSTRTVARWVELS